MPWQINKTNTLLSGEQPLTLSELTTLDFNILLSHTLDGGLTSAPRISIQDAGTGTNHSGRTSKNGAAFALQTSRGDWVSNGTENASDQFQIAYIQNIDGEEKLAIHFCCDESAAGSGTATERRVGVGKYVVTSGQFTQIDIVTSTGNNYATDSNLTVLSTD